MFFWCIKESGWNNKDEQTTHYTRYICVRLHSINMKSEQPQVSLTKKIGTGLDFFTPKMIAKCIRTECPIGIFQANGKWMINTEVPSSTEGTIAACDIVIDFEHMDMDEFSVDWTVTDWILEGIRCEEERQDEAEAEAAEIKANEEDSTSYRDAENEAYESRYIAGLEEEAN